MDHRLPVILTLAACAALQPVERPTGGGEVVGTTRSDPETAWLELDLDGMVLELESQDLAVVRVDGPDCEPGWLLSGTEGDDGDQYPRTRLDLHLSWADAPSPGDASLAGVLLDRVQLWGENPEQDLFAERWTLSAFGPSSFTLTASNVTRCDLEYGNPTTCDEVAAATLRVVEGGAVPFDATVRCMTDDTTGDPDAGTCIRPLDAFPVTCP